MSTPFDSANDSDDKDISNTPNTTSSSFGESSSDQFGAPSYSRHAQPEDSAQFGQSEHFGQPSQPDQFGQPAFGQPQQFGQPPYGQPGQPPFGQAPMQPMPPMHQQAENPLANVFDLSFVKDRTPALAKLAFILDIVAIGIMFFVGLLAILGMPLDGGDMAIMLVMYVIFGGFFAFWAIVCARRITEWFVNSSRNAATAAQIAAALEQQK